ncbi:DUF433 domain-containing protein [Halobacteriales archaeon QS_1_69_70]|nr:MAG: DUF433 domain-containing protein [Halobacteriales archaeon QS_1_69_70]
MSQQETRIVQDILDEPHIDGRRVPVLTIVERVEGSGLTPQTVADRHNLDISEVYAALLYYHDHPREFEKLRRDRQQIMADVEGSITRPDGVTPPDEG